MPGNNTNAEHLSARGVAIRLIGALIMLALVFAVVFALFRGAAGCASFLRNAEYVDEDEAARFGTNEPAATARVFTDSAYDAVYPDLAEYTDAERSEAD